MGAQLPVRRLLRLVGRRASARVRADEPALRRVRVERADQQLPAARPRGAGLPEEARRHADDRDGLLRRGDRGDLRGARLRPDPAVRRAAPPARLQDRHHPARQRGRRPVGAQRARHRGLLDASCASWRSANGLGTDLVVQTPYGDSGKTTFFIKSEADLDKSRRRHRRRAAQGDEADRQQGRCGRGVHHQARHDRRPVHDRPDRLPGAHAVQGRLVRQRPVPRGAHPRAAGARDRPRPQARRPARQGGLPGLPRDRRPRRPRDRRRSTSAS